MATTILAQPMTIDKTETPDQVRYAYYDRPEPAGQTQYDGRSTLNMNAETKALYEILEDAGRQLGQRYRAGGTIDTASAWVSYLLQVFDVTLDNPVKSEAFLKNLLRDLQARLQDQRW